MLRLLDEVSYAGRPVASERSQALLAALVSTGGRAVGEATLVEAVWGADDVPANPGKALQVVVSRTRTQTAPEVVARVDGGYRLGLQPGDVDHACLATWVREARSSERHGDHVAARGQARSALGLAVAAPGELPEALEELRAAARVLRDEAVAVLGRVTAALGDHDEALGLLRAVTEPDEATLVALLRSEAAVHGVPAALDSYERRRAALADRLGVDPGPALQALHAELLAADNPVRDGVHFDATTLVGRDDDVRRLRALVRESRVTSILGPGGLGKTRIAHVLGREAEQPVVHFVELVGVVSPDDVVGEVGSALGVRDSVSGRRVLTPEQRADVRTRIAQQLDQAPTLLILDNCEHVVEAVADLVATLVATTSRLRVVTTTRAPLAIAAEQVFALRQLDDDAAADLFRQRALAARPDARLDDDAVRRVVARLDGLPLAVELAAAKVRVMSVDDIDRRLDDRFALLRGSDRGKPDRHQTLLDVIDWSWNLLEERDRRAWRRLAVMPDGFALDGAEGLVGPDALEAVESLVGQSLLTVRDVDGAGEAGGGVRFRMLETVREFGLLRLDAAGERDEARAALRAWAVATSRQALGGLYGPGQVAVVRALAHEENNLADVLREALADDDAPTVVVVLAALGGFWTIRGDHARVVVLATAVDSLLAAWEPPDELADATARAAGVVVMNTTVAGVAPAEHARRQLGRLGARASDPSTRALGIVVEGVGSLGEDLSAYVDHEDRHVAMIALQWWSHHQENSGELDGAVAASRRALALWAPEDGPWMRALHQTQLAGLYSQLGEPELASEQAAGGLDTLDALEASDDAVQLRSVLASNAVVRGDLAEAERILAEIEARPRTGLWGNLSIASTRAELDLARGRTAAGLAHYDESVVAARQMTFPGMHVDEGVEPWVLFAESSALTANARHGTGEQGVELVTHMRANAARVAAEGSRIDFPMVGCLLFSLGAWALLREGRPEEGIDLVALAERFAYSRYAPSMRWELIEAEAEAALPGRLAEQIAVHGGRRGPELLEEARAVLSGALRAAP